MILIRVDVCNGSLQARMNSAISALHPTIRIEIEEAPQKGRCSVAHAVAMSRNARFPMRRDGFTPEQLAAFATHPCVELGFTYRQLEFGKVIPRAKKLTAVAAGMKREFICRSALLTSLHELSDALGPKDDTTFCPRGGAVRAHDIDDFTIERRYVQAFFQSLGFKMRPELGYRSMPLPPFPEFVETLRTRKISEKLNHLDAHLNDEIRHVIFPTEDDLDDAWVADSVERVATGLTAAGLKESPAAAVRWMLRWFNDGIRQSKLTVEQALGFVKAASTLGVEMMLADVPRVSNTFGQEQEMPAGWQKAVEIHQSEREMRQVLARAGATPGTAAKPAPVTNSRTRCL